MMTYRNTITVKEYNYLRESVGWGKIEEEQAQRGLEHSSYLIAAYQEDQAIGCARVITDGGYVALIVDVIILPAFQGRGIGTELMNKVMSYLNSTINENQSLMVNLMAATHKEAFYKKFGFIERPNETMGAGMIKWLNKR